MSPNLKGRRCIIPNFDIMLIVEKKQFLPIFKLPEKSDNSHMLPCIGLIKYFDRTVVYRLGMLFLVDQRANEIVLTREQHRIIWYSNHYFCLIGQSSQLNGLPFPAVLPLENDQR